MKSRVHTGLVPGLIFAWVVLNVMGCTLAPATLTPAALTSAPSTEGNPTNTPVPATATQAAVTTPTVTPAPPDDPTATPGSDPSSPPVGAKTGDTAIDFTLPDLQGQEVALGSLRGQVVLVNFWATWCGFCRVEMPDLQAAFETYGDQGFVILGIDVQEGSSVVESYVKQLGITFPILLDKQAKVTTAYRIRGLPTSVLIDRQGVIQAVHLGPLTEQDIADFLAPLGIE